MNKILELITKSQTARRRPKVGPGDIIRVYHKVVEAKTEKGKGGEKTQIFEGIVLGAKNLSSPSGTFTVRKVSFGVGVEKIFPFYSPMITRIDVIKKSKIRCAKLYYLRELSGKKARMKEKDFDEKTLKMLGWESLDSASSSAKASADRQDKEPVADKPQEENEQSEIQENSKEEIKDAKKPEEVKNESKNDSKTSEEKSKK